jgi:quercetin dioxygenase-like cupin family protein
MIIKNYQEVKAEPVTDAGAEKANVRWVIAEKDGAKNFFMRVFEIEPGGYTPLHHHPWEHEMFVCGGKGCVVKEGKEVSLAQGSVVFIPPNEEHQIKNTSQELFTLICLIPAH